MTSVSNSCIICGNEGKKITLNDLGMFSCDFCGLIWRRSFELPVNNYSDKNFDLENKNKISARYNNARARIELFRRYADLNNLCDIGCGEGIFLDALKEYDYKNTIGLEPSVTISSFAQERSIEIFQGTIETLDKDFLKEKRIHAVTLLHVIEHLKNPKEILNHIYESLPLGGFLIIETPNIYSKIFKMRGYKDKLIYPEHLWYFSEKTLHTLLKQNGFHIVASGKRDFDQFNMPIKESLHRLGILHWKPIEKKVLEGAKNEMYSNKLQKSSIFRSIVRFMLSRIVIWTGRLQYTWIVVQKSS